MQMTLQARILAIAAILAGSLVITPPLRPQSRTETKTPIAFEAASIKPNPRSDGGTGDLRLLPGGRLSAESVVLRHFIENAYAMKSFQLFGGPGWLDSERYDIEAKAPGDPSPAEMRRMMHRLLEDRFKLKAHRSTKELPVYSLTAAKGGLKLQPPKEGGCVSATSNGAPTPPRAGTPDPTPCGRILVAISLPKARLAGGRVAMPELMRVLSNLLGRPVIDKTGFSGEFDVRLEFFPDDSLAVLRGPYRPDSNAPPASMPDPAGPTLFNVMRDQLGLKIESSKGRVETLVIDHIERPTAN